MKSPEQFGPQSEQYKKQEEIAVASEELFEDSEMKDLEKKDVRIEQYEQLIGIDEATEIREIVSALYKPMKRMLEPVLEKINGGEFHLSVRTRQDEFRHSLYENLLIELIKRNICQRFKQDLSQEPQQVMEEW